MSTAELLTAIRALPIEERLELARAIEDEATAEMDNAPLSDAMKAELERRVAHTKANPGDFIPWEVVQARAEERIRTRQADPR